MKADHTPIINKTRLDELYETYNSRKWVHPDPLEPGEVGGPVSVHQGNHVVVGSAGIECLQLHPVPDLALQANEPLIDIGLAVVVHGARLIQDDFTLLEKEPLLSHGIPFGL